MADLLQKQDFRFGFLSGSYAAEPSAQILTLSVAVVATTPEMHFFVAAAAAESAQNPATMKLSQMVNCLWWKAAPIPPGKLLRPL